MERNEVAQVERLPALPSVSLTSVLQAQIEAVVNIQASMAFRRPRDEADCLAAILEGCRDPVLAEKAEYEFPRGNTKVTGPTVHLLRAIAQRWKNINTQIMEVGRSGDESKVMVYALDVENNYLEQMSFSVPHYRSSKEKGRVRLTDDRDIYEMVANQGARRQRKCLEDIIPRGVVQQAIAECKKTLAAQAKATPLAKRIAKAVKGFKDQYKVGEEQLAIYIGRPKEQWGEDDLHRIGSLFNAIRDGHVSVDSAFAPKEEDNTGGSPGDAAADELEARVKQAGGDAPGELGIPLPGAPDDPPASIDALTRARRHQDAAASAALAAQDDADGTGSRLIESASPEPEASPPSQAVQDPGEGLAAPPRKGPNFPRLADSLLAYEREQEYKNTALRAILSHAREAWARLGEREDAVQTLFAEWKDEWAAQMFAAGPAERHSFAVLKQALAQALAKTGLPNDL